MELVSTNKKTELCELVRRIITGDPAAEDKLVRRYSEGVFLIIDQIVRNRSATEDVSQETFAIVLAKLRQGNLRQPERLSGFVCTVARNTAFNHLRQAKRFRNSDEIFNVEHIPDPAPSQLDEILKQDQAERVRQMINELKNERDRQLLFRYYIAEENKDRICQDLGLTRIQLNNIIYRALARFRELLIRDVDELEWR